MQHSRKIIYLAGFLFSLPVALLSYINSSFLASFVGEKFVGIIYIFGAMGSILALLLAPKMLKIWGGCKFLLAVSLISALCLLSFALVKNAFDACLMFIIYLSINTLIIFSLDELLKIFSKNSATGKIRGIYITTSNLAWIVALVAFGSLLGGFTFKVIYFIGFVLMSLFFFTAYLFIKDFEDPTYDKINTLKYIQEFFKNKNLFRAYGMTFLLQFFYCWMVVYTPIYLSAHLGFSWKEIGIIFSIMLLPFVIIPFNLGKISDKIGERKILMFGFAVASLATLSLFFIKAHSVLVWALALFITRVGASSIEVMSDAYFFKHIKPENEEFVGVYRSASPVAYIIGPLVAFITLLFVPSFNFIFLILGALVLSGVYLSSTIQRSDV